MACHFSPLKSAKRLHTHSVGVIIEYKSMWTHPDLYKMPALTM